MKDWFSTLGRPKLGGGVTPWEHSDGRPVHDPDAHGGWFCAPPQRFPERVHGECGTENGDTNTDSKPAVNPLPPLSH
jgi:hypothetical protein